MIEYFSLESVKWKVVDKELHITKFKLVVDSGWTCSVMLAISVLGSPLNFLTR